MSGTIFRSKTMQQIALAICVCTIALLAAGLSVGRAGSGKAAALFGGGGGTATLTPKVTPTRTPITGALKNQLAWGGLGAGGDPMPCEKSMLKNKRVPALVELGRNKYTFSLPFELDNEGGVCIFGLPFRAGFTVDLYKPNGEIVDHVIYQPAGNFDGPRSTIWNMQPTGKARSYPVQHAADLGGMPAIYLDLWWPAGLPEGRWSMTLSTPNDGFATDFTVPPFPQKPVVRLNQPPVWIFPNASPLDSPKEKISTVETLNGLKNGDSIRLYGANFTAGSVPLIGLYLQNLYPDANGNLSATLVNQINTRADRNGAWQINYTIPASDPPGYYTLIVVLDPQTEWGNFIGNQITYRLESWQPCPSSYASLLRAGMRAKVIEGQKANRLRAQPNSNGNIIGSIPAGQPFDVLDGPRCANNWVWWYVRAPDGKTGWTAEGDQSQRWLIPVGS